MKRFITYILFLLLITVGYAQSSEQSKQLLDKTYELYQNSKGTQITFSFIIEENGKVQQQQEGIAKFRGNMFNINLPEIEIWFDGTTQWLLMKAYDEVNISEPTLQETASISPMALLNIYKTGYKLDAPQTLTIAGQQHSSILMHPTSDNNEYKNIKVVVNNSASTIAQVEITFKNGVKNKINITQYNPNFNFSNTEFVFQRNQYKNIEIIDLR